MKVQVETYDADRNPAGTRVVDYDNHESRVWLSKHLLWAFRNGHGVQAFAVADETPLMNEDPTLEARKAARLATV